MGGYVRLVEVNFNLSDVVRVAQARFRLRACPTPAGRLLLCFPGTACCAVSSKQLLTDCRPDEIGPGEI